MKFPFRRFRYFVVRRTLIAFERFFALFPIGFINAAMRICFRLLFPLIYLLPSLYRPLMRNISIVYGRRRPLRERRALAKRVLERLFIIPFEIFYYVHPRNHKDVVKNFRIRGIEHLEDAFAKGRGVIGIGAHQSNFLLMVVRLEMSGIPFRVVLKYPHNDFIRARYDYHRKQFHVNAIDADNETRAAIQTLKSLKKNMMVFMVVDERKKRGGILVPFFGKEALTTPGPAILSLRTGAPLVPIFMRSDRGHAYLIEIFPEIPVESTGDAKRDTYAITEKINKTIESYILNHPDEWAWVNDRWEIKEKYLKKIKPRSIHTPGSIV